MYQILFTKIMVLVLENGNDVTLLKVFFKLSGIIILKDILSQIRINGIFLSILHIDSLINSMKLILHTIHSAALERREDLPNFLL